MKSTTRHTYGYLRDRELKELLITLIIRQSSTCKACCINGEAKKRKLSKENVNLAKVGEMYTIGGDKMEIYKFCGNGSEIYEFYGRGKSSMHLWHEGDGRPCHQTCMHARNVAK